MKRAWGKTVCYSLWYAFLLSLALPASANEIAGNYHIAALPASEAPIRVHCCETFDTIAEIYADYNTDFGDGPVISDEAPTLVPHVESARVAGCRPESAEPASPEKLEILAAFYPGPKWPGTNETCTRELDRPRPLT